MYFLFKTFASLLHRQLDEFVELYEELWKISIAFYVIDQLETGAIFKCVICKAFSEMT